MHGPSPLAARIPPWIAARPHLACRLLLWRNAYRHRRGRLLLFAALIVAGCAIVAVLPPTGPVLRWLGRNWAVAFVIAACTFTLATARGRQRASIEAAASWLAPLPARSPVVLQVIAGSAGWLAAIIAYTGLLWAADIIDGFAFSRLAVAVAAGTTVGLLAGWRLPRAGIGAPGYHYAIVRRPRERWASAPSLSPLASWPAAQGRIFSRPKKTAPLLLIAMMAIPSGLHGAPGQVALAVAGVCLVLFSIFSLAAAGIRVAFEAARWLAPTTLGTWRFTGALMWRVLLTQTLGLGVLVFLASAIDLPRALGAGLPLAALFLCASASLTVLAAFRACRTSGLGAAGRGA